MTVDDLLHNWRRWCLSTDDCYPAGYPPQCSVERIALPYRVLISEDEALEQIEATREPDARWAELAEGWIQQLDSWSRVAIQTHYVYVPNELQAQFDLTSDQLAGWRARRLARHLGRSVTVDEFNQVLGGAVAELRDALRAYSHNDEENARVKQR